MVAFFLSIVKSWCNTSVCSSLRIVISAVNLVFSEVNLAIYASMRLTFSSVVFAFVIRLLIFYFILVKSAKNC